MDPRVYLAGPDVFDREPLVLADSMKRVCAQHRLLGVFPLDAELQLEGLSPFERGLAISRANEALIRECQGLLANMTPFRGPSVDVGTAFEMGYARALGIPVVGYTSRPESFRERTMNFLGASVCVERQPGVWEDSEGWAIEDFELVDNLMLDGGVVASGGQVFRPVAGESNQAVFARAVSHLAGLLTAAPSMEGS